MADKLTFSSKVKVQEYAINQGYDMGASKLNSTLSEKLKGIPKKNGVWFKADIDNLLLYGRFKRLAGVQSNEVSELDRKIKEADLREKEGKADKVERENSKADGLLIERSNVYRELVARMIQLKKDEKTDNKVKSADIIFLVGGDIEKEKELQKYLDIGTDRRLNRYAKPFKFAVSMSEMEKEITAIEEEETSIE